MNEKSPLPQYKPVYAAHLPEPDDEMQIDVRALLYKLWLGKWIVLVCTLFAGTFGLLTSSQIDPVYRATAKVMFDPERREIIDVGNEVGTLASDGNLQNQIEVLQSANLIGKVVEKLSLERNPEINSTLLTPEPTLIEDARNSLQLPLVVRDYFQDLGIVAPPAPPPAPPDPAVMAEFERRLVFVNVQSRLGLSPVPNSNVINISFVSGNPNTAAQVANTFAEQYIVDQLDAKLEATRAATNWLSGRVEELRDRLQIAEEAVETARATLTAEVGQSLAITQDQLRALNATLSVARNQTRTSKATYERLKRIVEDERELDAIPEFRASSVVSSLQERASVLRTERFALSETNPRVRVIDAQLAEVNRSMRIEASRIVEAYKVDWESQLLNEREIQTDVRKLEELALEQSRDQVTIRQLEREAEASRILYENFLARMKETSEQERLQTADARILTPASPPIRPLTEAKNRTLAISIVAGLMAGVGLIFLLDKLNNTFRSTGQLEQLTGQTVLGSVPIVGRRMRRSTVLTKFKNKPKSSLAEAVRNLRTSILFSNVDKPPQVVMFTSTVPREGKSTTATLIALTSGQMGKSAIIVDCDLRLPALAELTGAVDDSPGLLSLIDGTATLADAVHRDRESGLHVLMTKPSEPRSNVNAADILSSKRFTDLIQELKRAYDLVILDTPPALVVADPRILSAQADAVVYAVRWDHTPRGAVLEGLTELRKINAPIAGLVMTMVNEKKAARYAYDSYGYGYYRNRYNNYYVE